MCGVRTALRVLRPQNLLGWDLSLNRQTFSFCPKIKGRLRLFQRLTQFLSFAVVLRLLAGNLRLWCKQQHPCDIPFRASGQGIFASRKQLRLFAASLSRNNLFFNIPVLIRNQLLLRGCFHGNEGIVCRELRQVDRPKFLKEMPKREKSIVPPSLSTYSFADVPERTLPQSPD